MIAILAMISVPIYSTYILRSKTAEVPPNLQAMVNGQLAFIERPRIDLAGLELYTCYVTSINRHPRMGVMLTPLAVSWSTPAPPASFALVNFAPSGNVYYSYSMDSRSDTGSFVQQPSADGYCLEGVGDGFADLSIQTLRVRAIGDLDGDSTSPIETITPQTMGRYARVITTVNGEPTVGPLISQFDYE